MTRTTGHSPPMVGHQKWRNLLFVHWAVPVSTLQARLPAGLTVDTFEGQAFVGLVAFTMHDVRPLRWLPPMPTAATFPEVNVRTYVRCGDRAGVWFFSLDAASSLAVVGARVGFGLPYFRASMQAQLASDGSAVDYRSDRHWPRPRPARLRAQWRLGEARGPAAAGTLEHFLVERYSLFATRRGTLVRADVRHRPYPLRQVAVPMLEETLLAAAKLQDLGARTPDLASDGVDVDVGPPVCA